MKKILTGVLIIVLIMITCLIPSKVYSEDKKEENTPVSIHGKLSVEGTDIVDKNGNKFQLRGISTHGLQWFPQYVNQDAFYYMRDKWGINTVRLAMYSNPNDGYKKEIHELVKNGVEYAKNAGIYVIIDWHILNDGNPNTNKQSAIEFFKEMTDLYKDYDNVIYEICNEPNGDVQWERDIKPYAEEVIREIRNVDDDAIIVVGTPTWSQDVDIVAQNPITGYENIMYTLHFYAATHKEGLRQKAQTALDKGLPLFVTEFGICDASGNGNLDIEEANTWIEFLNQNNISWMCWNLSNKDESSAILKNTDKTTDWEDGDLSESGKWLVEALNNSKQDESDVSQDDNPRPDKDNNTDDNKGDNQNNEIDDDNQENNDVDNNINGDNNNQENNDVDNNVNDDNNQENNNNVDNNIEDENQNNDNEQEDSNIDNWNNDNSNEKDENINNKDNNMNQSNEKNSYINNKNNTSSTNKNNSKSDSVNASTKVDSYSDNLPYAGSIDYLLVIKILIGVVSIISIILFIKIKKIK